MGGAVDLTWVGCYLGGRPQGSCWQRLEGGAWLVGPTGGGPGTADSLLFFFLLSTLVPKINFIRTCIVKTHLLGYLFRILLYLYYKKLVSVQSAFYCTRLLQKLDIVTLVCSLRILSSGYGVWRFCSVVGCRASCKTGPRFDSWPGIPDGNSLLSNCNEDSGEVLLAIMRTKWGVTPTINHHTPPPP